MKKNLLSLDRQPQLKQLVAQAKTLRWYDVAGRALNLVTPRQHFRLNANIAYGEHPRQRLDIYYSQNPQPHRPLIVFVHGGAWQHGRKEDYVFLADTLTRAGYDVVVPNYQLSPAVIFPTYVHDLHLALSFLSEHQQSLNLSVDAWTLMGHSAGAFNVLSVLYHPEPFEQLYLPLIQKVIGLAGPYHFDYKGDPLAGDAFDQQVSFQQVMPKYFAHQNQIQHLLLVAEKDEVVGDFNAYQMANALAEVGNHVEVQIVPKVSHLMILASLSYFVRKRYQTEKQILAFLQS